MPNSMALLRELRTSMFSRSTCPSTHVHRVSADRSRRRGLGDADETLVKKYLEDLDRVLTVYDGILAKQAYIAGDEVSLADLFHLSYGKMAKDLGAAEIFAKHPNVDRWFSALEKRESWIKVNQF